MAIFSVANTNDSGAGSLRAAIDAANANIDADTIVFSQSMAGLTIGLSSGNLTIIQGTVAINGDLNGDGDPDVIISGSHTVSIFSVAPAATATLNSLTLINGSANSGSLAGAIRNDGNLSINYSVILGNSSNLSSNHTGASTAGGIVNGGLLTINQTVMDGNSGQAGKGALQQLAAPAEMLQAQFST
jgi:hypothetical protein